MPATGTPRPFTVPASESFRLPNGLEVTLAEIKQLDAGSWFAPEFAGERVPTLAEWVGAVGNRAGMLLEPKAPELYPGIEIDLDKEDEFHHGLNRILGEPEQWMAGLVEALRLTLLGREEEATALRGEALEALRQDRGEATGGGRFPRGRDVQVHYPLVVDLDEAAVLVGVLVALGEVALDRALHLVDAAFVRVRDLHRGARAGAAAGGPGGAAGAGRCALAGAVVGAARRSCPTPGASARAPRGGWSPGNGPLLPRCG